MNRNGLTLLELVMVIAIMSALLGLATLAFNRMGGKASVESQTKSMFADLMSVRSRALYEKRGRSVVITSTTFSAYSTTTISTPVSVKVLNPPVTPSNLRVDFDEWGVMTLNSDTTIADASVCAQQSNDGVVDSVVIYRSNIRIGKLNGTGCTSANIDIK